MVKRNTDAETIARAVATVLHSIDGTTDPAATDAAPTGAKRGRKPGQVPTVRYGNDGNAPVIDLSAFEAATVTRGRAPMDWAATVQSKVGEPQTLVYNVSKSSAQTYMTKVRAACKDAKVPAVIKAINTDGDNFAVVSFIPKDAPPIADDAATTTAKGTAKGTGNKSNK